MRSTVEQLDIAAVTPDNVTGNRQAKAETSAP
jgi:hypothetical protein